MVDRSELGAEFSVRMWASYYREDMESSRQTDSD